MKSQSFLTLTLILGFSLSYAARPDAPDFPAVLNPGTNQASPAVAYNPVDQQYLVVWTDDRHLEQSGVDVYGQLLAPDGRPLGRDFPISTAPGGQQLPVVVYNYMDYEYLVVWSDDRNTAATGLDLYGQRLARDGTLTGDEFPINAVPGAQQLPAVAYNSKENQYLVVWQDTRNLLVSGNDLYGQILSPQGRPFGRPFVVSDAPNNQVTPAAAYNYAAHQYLVVWGDLRNGSSGSDIYGQRLAAGGRLIGSNFPIATAPAGQQVPVAAYDYTTNQYLVAWEDSRSSATTGSDIYGQILSGEADLVGNHFPITTAAGNQQRPALAYHGRRHQYLVAWSDERHSATSGFDIYGQRVSPQGELIGGDLAIATASLTQAKPAVIYNPIDPQYFLVWEDGRRMAHSGSEIYGRRVRHTGRPAGTDFPISSEPSPESLRPAFGNQTSPTTAYNSTEAQYLIVWEDARRGAANLDIYGQIVSSTGELLIGPFPIAVAPNNQTLPFAAYNGTDNQYLVIWDDRRDRATNGQDLYGQILSAQGEPIGHNFPIAAGPDDEGRATVVYNAIDQQYLAVWEDSRNLATNGVDIYGQRLSNDGRLLGEAIPVSTAPMPQARPYVAHNSQTNEYLVVFRDDRNMGTPTGRDIYGQRMAADGRLLGDNFPVSTAPGAQNFPSVAYNGTDNEYLVVWWEDRNAATSGDDIYGQRLSSTGVPLGGDLAIATAPRAQGDPSVTYNPVANEYLVVWEDGRDFTTSSPDIYGQRIAKGLVGGNFPITRAPRGQAQAFVTCNPTGGQYLVVWQDSRNTGASGTDLYGRIMQ